MLTRREIIAKVRMLLAEGAFFDEATKNEIARLSQQLKKVDSVNIETILDTFAKRKRFTEEQYGLMLDKLVGVYRIPSISPEHKAIFKDLFKKHPSAQARLV